MNQKNSKNQTIEATIKDDLNLKDSFYVTGLVLEDVFISSI